ncbi:hypothetical protein SLA_2391 [Streptomyces laurentii]|uniref:Uncharacterized protein n=1 Tax=Streptomyces laurentii TaxID=39478 RepID=A0A169NEE3_STRLU|nr:hypothetical protein SLA_2391 [Streptomyces laurentii]
MHDLLPCAVLVLLAVGAATVAVGIVCAVLAAGRALRHLVSPRPRPAAELPAPRRCVWLACHTPRCGHMQTPHYPAGPGYVMCDRCGAHRRTPAP